MPSGRNTELHPSQHPFLSDQPTPSSSHSTQGNQIKVCADCSGRLSPEQSVLHDEIGDGNAQDTIILCPGCKEARLELSSARLSVLGSTAAASSSTTTTVSPFAFADVNETVPFFNPLYISRDTSPSTYENESSAGGSSFASNSSDLLSSLSDAPSPNVRPTQPWIHIPQTPSSSLTARKQPPPTVFPIIHSPNHSATPHSPHTRQYSPPASSFVHSNPDPYVDITRLRVPSRGRHCLYSGATFQGVQKSGRNSYDVTVTVVDVDFSTSFLCGYLEIRGLTEDWPQLTTYFDAEIIGPRYGFLTQGWGATEKDDLTHWKRFPSFSNDSVQEDLKLPFLTLRERPDRGCVFMRWKERFLVPDHRVKDINGASFAGFYYVCVEFEPKERLPMRSPTAEKLGLWDYGTDQVTASMSGYYFHQNSEPYQQLSLHHIPDEGSGTFEFR